MSKLNNTPGRLIAFDQATRFTGFSCFDGPDLIKYGLLEANGTDSEARLDEMATMMEELVDHYNPEMIVFEGVLYQKSPSALILLSNLQGILRGICHSKGCSYRIYAPTAWRRILEFQQGAGIKRDDLKLQAIQFVKDAYGVDVTEDACEAICIGLAHLKSTGVLPELEDARKRHRNFKEQ